MVPLYSSALPDRSMVAHGTLDPHAVLTATLLPEPRLSDTPRPDVPFSGPGNLVAVPDGPTTTTARPASTIAAAPSPERARRMMLLLAGIADCTDPQEQARRRSIVVQEYLPVARSIAARYRGRGVERGDLEQLASLGLVKSVARWMPDRSEDFLQFAVPTISGEIKRYFRDHSWTVRPPRRVQELRVAIADAEQIYWQRHGCRPSDADIARIIGVPASAVAEARTSVALCRPPSLDADTGAGWAMAQTYGDTDHDLERVEDRLAVDRMLSTLTEQERRVVDLRFQHGWSQSQIAQEVGVSQMQISRWLRDITGKLRTACL